MKFVCSAAFFLAIVAFGCKPTDDKAAGLSAADPGMSASTAAPSGGGDTTTVAPMAGVGAGPMAPVSGAESVQGGGSAAGSVLKEKAKGVAGTSPSSLNQMPADEE